VTSQRWLRSVVGQVTLLAGALAGAVVLAVVAVLLRALVFEPTVYHRLPEVSAEVADAVVAFARDPSATKPAIRDDEREQVYAVWLVGDLPEAQLDRVARYLASPAVAVQTLGWVQRTLATGNPAQRQRALILLGYFADVDPDDHAQTALALIQREHERAKRRGESELVEVARTILQRFESILAD
jgi:hypothetical protein